MPALTFSPVANFGDHPLGHNVIEREIKKGKNTHEPPQAMLCFSINSI